MNLAGCGVVLGAVVGAVGGFLLGAGPSLIYDFLPHPHPHWRCYPWPVDVMVTGYGGALTFLLPGMFFGGIAGVVLRRVQSRDQKPDVPPEVDSQTWPPAPKPPDAAE